MISQNQGDLKTDGGEFNPLKFNLYEKNKCYPVW